MTTSSFIRSTAATLVLTTLALAACKRADDAPRGVAAGTPFSIQHIDVPSSGFLSPYPKGRWRLVDRRVLERSLVWASHILIRHQGVPSGITSFAVPLWFPAPPLPERTREQALALAQTVRAEVAAAPERFAELATKYSEDIVTSGRGGSLGGVGADTLYRWPQVLDALAALATGAVSEVVETEYGFHILWRRPPPPKETVSGIRLVIGYDEAPWLKMFLARGPVPARSRGEALMLAQHLYERASSSPKEFSALIAEHSEHIDAVRGGDLGQWSTHEPTLWPREVEILQSLRVGEVAAPIDTLMGIELIQRTPNRPRQTLSMTAVQVPFAGDSSSRGAESRAAALEQIQAAARTLRSDPSRFPALLDDVGRYEPHPWQEGRDAAPIEARLLALDVGAIDPEPVLVDSLSSYLIVQRTAPAGPGTPANSPGALLDIPSPEVPDVRYWISEELSAKEVRSLLVQIGATSQLDADQQGSLQPAIETFHDNISAEDAADAYDRFVEHTVQVLGAAKSAEYWAAFARALEKAALAPRGATAR